MKVRIAYWLEKITSNFWVIPTVITVALIGLQFLISGISLSTDNIYLQQIFFLKSKPDAVRMLLSSIATSIMTVLGVVFSILMVVIQQMSTQYSPRVVSNFTRSKLAQVVLGLYVGTFIYNLVLLMNIGNDSVENPIPRLAVVVAGLLAISCLIALIFYIHHVTRSIQSTEIISNIAKETINTIRNVAEGYEKCQCKQFPNQADLKHHHIYHADKIGYIETINWQSLAGKIPCDHWILHFHVEPGDFVQKETELFSLRCNKKFDTELNLELSESIIISELRTMAQDPFYGLEKLTDIALKGLSPGINDPSTAIEAIHAITSVILEYVRGKPWPGELCLEKNKLLMIPKLEFKYLLEISYGHILVFTKDHFVIKELIKNDLRLIQRGHNLTDEDKNLIEEKIATI